MENSERVILLCSGGGYDIIEHFSNQAPPAFIWQTRTDGTVSYEENSKALCAVMTEEGHLFREKMVEDGMHGLGLGTNSPADGWLEELLRYWDEIK